MPIAPSDPDSKAPLIVVMGVSGCGKTSVGQGIAAWLGAAFIEGDALHPRRNVEKMSAGIPLDDDDRWPWLDLISGELRQASMARQALVVSCSALKTIYRERLRQAADDRLCFVFLRGSREALLERLAQRRGHYMPVSLLDSQLGALEDPAGEQGVVAIDIGIGGADQVLEAVRARLFKSGIGPAA
ncbi:gluconokinase [Labrys wisconsinensis]|uniref:Gluconokinase n=1 Tax=Labrys wisconsinensis TaxID=425677 RepID=A0ABU0JAV3_9HYPH|nr:gluconokinase [Labrys wisconsinensis]MDQ0471396.1 gluconokinase [Labrys wisconsinensis]